MKFWHSYLAVLFAYLGAVYYRNPHFYMVTTFFDFGSKRLPEEDVRLLELKWADALRISTENVEVVLVGTTSNDTGLRHELDMETYLDTLKRISSGKSSEPRLELNTKFRPEYAKIPFECVSDNTVAWKYEVRLLVPYRFILRLDVIYVYLFPSTHAEGVLKPLYSRGHRCLLLLDESHAQHIGDRTMFSKIKGVSYEETKARQRNAQVKLNTRVDLAYKTAMRRYIELLNIDIKTRADKQMHFAKLDDSMAKAMLEQGCVYHYPNEQPEGVRFKDFDPRFCMHLYKKLLSSMIEVTEDAYPDFEVKNDAIYWGYTNEEIDKEN